MAGDDRTSASGAAAGLALDEAERALLEQIREQITERSKIRSTAAPREPGNPRETKRARLERNQEQLESLFDEALARPAVVRALSDTGYDAADLRQAAAKGTWARDVAPAINAIQATTPDQDVRHRETVERAARAMNDLVIGQPVPGSGHWVDELERGVRASLAGKRVSDTRVAERFVMWAEEAMTALTQPVATAARDILVERFLDGELKGAGQGPDEWTPALRAALQRSGMIPVAKDDRQRLDDVDPVLGTLRRSSRQSGEEGATAEANRVIAADDAETPPGRRQVDDLTAVAREAGNDPTETKAGLISRLRGYWARTGEGATSVRPIQSDDSEALPDALKRRYAVHVSRDGRMIELFEAGAKAAAITLDAKSITTTHNEGVVISDIVLLARDRGWQAIKVSGTAEFKDAVWLEASKAGLSVQHEPSSAVRASYAKWDQERPANQIQQGGAGRTPEQGTRRNDDLAQAFAAKSAEERLADQRLRNAQLELMIGIRTAEKELKRPIAEMPEVAQALAAAVREQLAQGRMFDAPFVKADPPKRLAKQVVNPRIEADRIPPPRV